MEIPDWVVGYHGTNRDAAARIVAGEFLPSTQSYGWLGHGFFLWQDSPWRAQEWAADRHGDQAVVLAVRGVVGAVSRSARSPLADRARRR